MRPACTALISSVNYTGKKIALINLPVLMSILTEQLINITDAVFLGHVGDVELGASALAGIGFLAIYMTGFGFSLGLQVVIARRNGEGRLQETGRTFFQGVFFLSALAIVLCGSARWLSPVILRHLIASDEVFRAVVRYLDWRVWGLLFSFPFLALRAFLVGITRTKALTVAALTAVVVNIPGNYLLLFRLDLGISGAATASAAAELCALAVLLFRVWGDRDKSRYGLRCTPDLKVLGAVLRISVWSMFQSFVSVAPWFLFFVAVEHLGETELAAANIIRSVSALFFVIVSSFGTTTGSLAGNLTGAGEAGKIPALCGKVIRLGYAAGGPLIVLALVFRRQVIGLYTDNPALVEAAALPFAVMLLNYAFALPAYVWMNAVSGTGATRTAFLFQATTIVFYLAYLWAVSYVQAPFLAFWGAEYLFVILLGLQSLVYLRKRRD